MPKKFIKSFKYAKAGAEHALKTQRNIWIHIFAGIIVIAAAFWFKISLFEISVLVLTISLVISLEMINTAIEELVNILSPGHRIEAALAKNVAAGAVLLAAGGSIIVGAAIFLPRILKL